MSDRLCYFDSPHRLIAVALAFDLDARVRAWENLRRTMIRERSEAFTRDEWAYLIAYLDPENLLRPFEQAFGVRVDRPRKAVDVLVRPRGPVAAWLPSNVSLLGSLVVTLVSLTGNPIQLKAGSQADDL